MGVQDDLITWLLSDDCGLSSQAIAAFMTGNKVEDNYYDYPLDCGDFGRCHRLLEKIPAFKARLHEMSAVSDEWARLISAWDEITTLYTSQRKSEATLLIASLTKTT